MIIMIITIIILRGGVLMSIKEYPGNFESTNLRRDNLGREIGRAEDHKRLTELFEQHLRFQYYMYISYGYRCFMCVCIHLSLYHSLSLYIYIYTCIIHIYIYIYIYIYIIHMHTNIL